MALDLNDLKRITKPGWRGLPDILAGDLFDLVTDPPPELCRCSTCRFDLRAHPAAGRCPECGHEYNHAGGEQAWNDLRDLLAMATGKKREDIQPESFLYRDLWFT